MYARRENGGAYPRPPHNYSGNAFREAAPPAMPEPTDASVSAAEDARLAESDESSSVSASAAPAGRFELGKLFGQGVIGSEELLLLGMILLLYQSNERDDLLLWLILLLFIR